MHSSPFPHPKLRTVLGEKKFLFFKISESSLSEAVQIPVAVLHGQSPGPICFITAAIHGDEVNGIPIVQKLASEIQTKDLYGILVLLPIVNVPGFFMQSRYLPYHRDFNRFFPGKSFGNNAEMMAYQMFSQIIQYCHFGIDLHTAARGHLNLPQIRGDMNHPVIRKMSKAFGVSILLDQKGVQGSLRYEATQKEIPTILFEAGEAGRISSRVSKSGVQGIYRVLNQMQMLKRYLPGNKKTKTEHSLQIIIKESHWIRVYVGGILEILVSPGDLVYHQEKIGRVLNPFGKTIKILEAPFTGIVIGVTTSPLSIPGSGLIHLAKLDKTLSKVEEFYSKRELTKK